MLTPTTWILNSRRNGSFADLMERLPAVGLVLMALLGGGALVAAAAWLAATGRAVYILPLLLLIPVGILFLRYPYVGILIWLLVYPFFTKNSSSAGSIMHWALYRLFIPGMLWFVLVSYWARVRQMPKIKFGLPDWAMLLFLVWAVGNELLLSQGGVDSFKRLYDRAFVPFAMYWLIRFLSPTERDLTRLLPVAVVIILIQSAVGLLAWIMPERLPVEWLSTVGERTVGTLGNPAQYSTTLILFSLLLFQYGMHTRQRGLTLALGVIFGLGFFFVYFTFSRGSWFGGTLVLLGLLVVYPRAIFRMLMLVAVATVLLSTTLLSPAFEFALERLNTERTAESRIITDAASLRMINERPLFGWGYDNYDLYNANFKQDVGSISAAGNINTSHNTYLTIAAELGIPALVLFLLPTLWWLVQSVRVWDRLPRVGFWSRSLIALLWLALLAEFAVSNFMDMVRFNLFGSTLWWVMLALIANLLSPYIESKSEPTPIPNAAALAISEGVA